MASGGPLLVDIADHVAVLTLNEPERRNPLSPALVSALTQTLQSLADENSCRVVVLTGAGRGFCAGADLSRMAVTSVAEDRDEYNAIIVLNQALWRYPKPTVAAVHGFALGGGCSLMNWCDFSIVEEGTRLGFPELVAGLPSTTVIPTLLRIIGRMATLELVLLGQNIDAARAAEIGLITRHVGQGEALGAARELARTLAAHDPGAVRLTKEIFRTVTDMPYDQSIAYAKEMRVLARAMSESAKSEGQNEVPT